MPTMLLTRARRQATITGALAFLVMLGAAPPSTEDKKPDAQRPVQPSAIRAFYIGHSLNSDIPDMVASFASGGCAGGDAKSITFREQFIPGAPLRWQWGERDRDSAQRMKGDQFRVAWFDAFATGAIDALVMVDSVPRDASMMPETLGDAGRFAEALAARNPKARIYIYEPWHCLRSGTPEGCDHDRGENSRLKWRERIDREAPMWDELVAALAQRFPAPRPTLIPAGRALGALADEAAAGRIAGLDSIEDFFDDAIHPNPYGKYFIACVHYAVLTGRSPVGLTTDPKDRWGRSYWNTPNWQGKQWAPPDPKAVRAMQELAWRTSGSAKDQQPAPKR
jgi:hypothetical protein